MNITNYGVFGLEGALNASGFPMRINFDEVDNITDSLKRGIKLGNSKSGSGHNCFLKGIVVNFDMEYSIYWTPQLQRYHFIDFISSSSSMHKGKLGIKFNEYVDDRVKYIVDEKIEKYNNNPTKLNFMEMISNFPQGQLKFAGMTTNYLQLQSIYRQRAKSHKLEDWHIFCAWIETLPHFVELCLNNERYYTNDDNKIIEDRIYYKKGE